MTKIRISRIAAICVLIFILFPLANGEGSCDYSIEILVEKKIFEVREFTFKSRIAKVSGDTSNVSSKISIVDGEGNIIKEYNPWKDEPVPIKRTSNAYTPNLRKGEYELMASVSPDCSESDLSNNEAVYSFTIYEENSVNDDSASKKTSSESKKDKTSRNIGDTSEEQRDFQQTNSMDITNTGNTNSDNTEYENEVTLTDIGVGIVNQNYAPQNSNAENKGAERNDYNQKDIGITAAVLINPLKNKNTDSINPNNENDNQMEKETVYEDSTLIAKKVGLVLLILVLVVLNAVLIWKR